MLRIVQSKVCHLLDSETASITDGGIRGQADLPCVYALNELVKIIGLPSIGERKKRVLRACFCSFVWNSEMFQL